MKNFLFIIILILAVSASAQTSDQEQIIRDLDQKDVKAVIVKDTATLKQLWSDDLTVNNPFNKIAKPGMSTLDRPVINDISYALFERNTEYVIIKNETAITMGNEVVIESDSKGGSGKTIKRRYTNIWMKEGTQWKLTARHASVICE